MSIYFIRNETTRNTKIGHSENVELRVRQLQQGNDCRLTLIAEIPGDRGLEKEYHDTWHAYRIVEEGEHGDEWFAVDVYPVDDGVKITGRKRYRSPKKVSRRRSGQGKFRHQLCLRLTDRQAELLGAYADIKDFDSSVDALRNIIDGLDTWLKREWARKSAEVAPSGLSSAPTDVIPGASIGASDTSLETEETPSPAPDDGEDDDGGDGTSVGDFGGHPRLKLPGMPSNDEIA